MPSKGLGDYCVLVCGAGSIGMRHIRNLLSLGVRVVVWRNRSELVQTLEEELRLKVFLSIDEALKIADAVVIATNTNTHLELALKAVKKGKAVFIEKPISHIVKGTKELSNIVNSQKLVFEVGCQLRAHPNLRRLSELIKQAEYGPLYTYRAVVGQRLEDWRPGTDYRQSYSADRQRGGGPMLDLIHEIDLVNWLTGPIVSVSAHLTKVSDQEIKSDDLANVTLINSNGSIGQVQLDMLSPSYRRGLELVYRDAIIYWDYLSGSLTCKKSGLETIIDQVTPQFERNTLFLNHMKHFLNRLVDPNIAPLCSLEDGIAALTIAECACLSDYCGSTIDISEVTV